MRILFEGVSGDDVRKVVKRLIKLSYFSETLTNKVTTEVMDSVSAFQAGQSCDYRGNPFIIDGLVGPITYHSLFPEEYSTSDLLAGEGLPEFTRAVLEFARGEVGVHEIGGDNRGKRVEQYQSSAGNSRGDPWCASYQYFICREVAKKLEVENPFLRTGRCQTFLDWGNERGYHVPVDKARAGDYGIILYGNKSRVSRSGHIFLITESDHSGYWETNEGNTNGSGSREGDVVKESTRKYSVVTNSGGGIIRLPV